MPVGLAATPPLPVSRRLAGKVSPMAAMASMTSSAGMRDLMPAMAISAAERAFMAPALDAGHLHKARHRVAHKAQHIFKRYGAGMGHLLLIPAMEVHKACRRHCGSGAHLRLAARLGSRDGSPGGYDRAKARGDIEGADELVIAGIKLCSVA